jgi:hypothetical protein
LVLVTAVWCANTDTEPVARLGGAGHERERRLHGTGHILVPWPAEQVVRRSDVHEGVLGQRLAETVGFVADLGGVQLERGSGRSSTVGEEGGARAAAEDPVVPVGVRGGQVDRAVGGEGQRAELVVVVLSGDCQYREGYRFGRHHRSALVRRVVEPAQDGPVPGRHVDEPHTGTTHRPGRSCRIVAWITGNPH